MTTTPSAARHWQTTCWGGAGWSPKLVPSVLSTGVPRAADTAAAVMNGSQIALAVGSAGAVDDATTGAAEGVGAGDSSCARAVEPSARMRPAAVTSVVSGSVYANDGALPRGLASQALG